MNAIKTMDNKQLIEEYLCSLNEQEKKTLEILLTIRL